MTTYILVLSSHLFISTSVNLLLTDNEKKKKTITNYKN